MNKQTGQKDKYYYRVSWINYREHLGVTYKTEKM